MDTPAVEGYRIGRLLGAGGCGQVYLATDATGKPVAVKVFHSLAVNRGLLAQAATRLAAGGWPRETLPLLHGDFSGRPALQVTPWIGTGDGSERSDNGPRSLQSELDDFPGSRSWPMVRALARALAALHERRVAHGNLKPGNVFLAGDGEPLLADWAMGNMPEIGRFEFTDAVLYQPPEQLRDPSGYADEAGYRWDVHAFGVLAYRLLTGVFPRCNEMFSVVAPAPGAARRDGIQVDLGKLAAHLEEFPEIAWPEEPGNDLEQAFRGLLQDCLSLDPLKRPRDMCEVAARFQELEEKTAAAEECRSLRGQAQHANRRAWRALMVAFGAATLAVFFAGAWLLDTARLRRDKAVGNEEIAALSRQAEAAVAERDSTVAREAEARRSLAHEAEVATARLVKSRQLGDQLFRWAMESGYRKLPPLDGREHRLRFLTQYYEEFLKQTAEMPEMADLHNNAWLQLAEIALSAREPAKAEDLLKKAVSDIPVETLDANAKLRLATDQLVLALLYQDAGAENTGEAFQNARAALAEVPDGTDPSRIRHLVAVLDYHEAKLLAAQGKDEAALEQLHQATVALDELVRERPDSAVLRSELASCYLSSASVIEGLGLLGDAAKIRSDALHTLLEVYKRNPADFNTRLELAGCYGAVSETALLAGDVAGADAASKEAMKLLEKLAAEQPDNATVTERMAAQLGVIASLLADSGKSKEALEKFETGVRMLESIRATKPADSMAAYRLSLLRWQQGRTVGNTGKRDEEIQLLANAAALLVTLEAKPGPESPPIDQIQRSLAYLLGDLGHARQMAGDKDGARQAFTDAESYWKRLLEGGSNSEEYREGQSWCRQRLAELR